MAGHAGVRCMDVCKGNKVEGHIWWAGALTQRAAMWRAHVARSWGAPRARRGPGVGPTTLIEQDRQIGVPPPTRAPGLRCHPLLKSCSSCGHQVGELIFKDRLYQGKEIKSHTRVVEYW